MADGGMDPCECVWNHEMAMQRLLNLLRSSQNACTDSECIQDGPLPGGDRLGDGYSTMMMMMIGWIVLAMALFLLRPTSLRRSVEGKPPRRNDEGDGNPPPGPSVQ